MTTITLTKEIVKALVQKGDRRRSALRQIAAPLLQTVEESKIIAALEANPRVQSGHLSPRKSYTGFRDQMTALALTSLVSGAQDVQMTLLAVTTDQNDTEFGMFWPLSNGNGDPYFVLTQLMQAFSAGKPAEVEKVLKGAANIGAISVVFDGSIPDWKKVMSDYAADADDDDTVSLAQAVMPAGSTAIQIKLPDVEASKIAIADTVLNTMGISSYAEIRTEFERLSSALNNAANGPKGMSINYNFVGQPALAGQAGIPSGKLVMRRAYDVFGITAGKEQFDFDVPTFDWQSPHPYVPDVDPDYMFQPIPLLRALWALVTNQKAWLHGHTGTGKSTLIEQICARTSYPMVRVNFDSEITRMDLIGRDVLNNSGGTVTTKFEDGILPKAMQMPCILLCDEMDFIRPDIAYVMQRALENKGLLVTEDGGRLIQPDPLFRIVATANTKGSGDDTGRYMGARPQSGAFLDRFTCWIEVDYMSATAVAKLIEAKVPGIDKSTVKVLRDYAREHWVGFRNGDILQPLSPRGLISAGNAYTFLKGVMPVSEALSQAIKTTISERCTSTDAQTIDGLVQRVSK